MHPEINFSLKLKQRHESRVTVTIAIWRESAQNAKKPKFVQGALSVLEHLGVS